MVVERTILPYFEWLIFGPQGFGAIPLFLLLLLIIGIVAVIGCYLYTAARLGPIEAFYSVAQTIAGAVPDFVRSSPRRIWAMAHLAIKESVRRKVIVGFVIFAVLVLYAGWFLDVDSDHPARLYLSFALTSANYLVLLLALLLSTLSLPADIKNRTIYTVITKPVRATEIIMGRMLGFACVGTILLALMGLISYGFVVRSLSHTHQLDADPQEIAEALARDGEWQGETTLNRRHRHAVRLTKDSFAGETAVATTTEQEHWHVIERQGDGAEARYAFSSPEGQLMARVPLYGKLSFLTRAGAPGRGVNVGNEWMYREYVEGGTLAAAIWRFDGVTEENFPDGLPLELNLRIFRTHKGKIERGVLGSIIVKNPNQSARINASTPYNFEAKEFVITGHRIPRKLQAVDSATGEVKDVDLFKDLVRDGKVDIVVQCAERGQYFGMAQADVYLRAADRPFALNFIKGYAAIWLQMLLVICFGVMFSTFLNGPVAIVATVGVVVLGFFAQFIVGLLGGVIEGNDLLVQLLGIVPGSSNETIVGGGPIESFIRLITQKNQMVDLDMPWLPEMLIKWTDLGFTAVLWATSRVLPDFRYFNTSEYVAYGFNISGNLMAQQLTAAFAFIVVLTIVGYFSLKTREIAA